MTAQPYVPAALPAPAINPAVGSFGKPVPYLSVSQFLFAPTGLDTSQLVPAGSDQSQEQAVADLIAQACGRADRFCFGADPAVKGASLCATISVEADYIVPLQGELRLFCDYKPIIELTGCDVGPNPGVLASIGAQAAQARFGRILIRIPWFGLPPSIANNTFSGPVYRGGKVYVVWSYVNGYPQTKLAADAAADDMTIVVEATDGNGGLLGVYPGSQLQLIDSAIRETVVVSSWAANTPSTGLTTITLASALVNAHTVPEAPDFLPVSGLPDDVHRAVIYIVSHLIKYRASQSGAIELPEFGSGEGSDKDEDMGFGAYSEDLAEAFRMLVPFRKNFKKERG